MNLTKYVAERQLWKMYMLRVVFFIVCKFHIRKM